LEARPETVLRAIDGRGFVDGAKVGDWVSFHWGWSRDVLREGQRALLERYTLHHLRLCNETL
jgi:hypothetical protein